MRSLHDGYVVNVDCAYTIRSLPITKAYVPDDSLLSEWARLAEVRPTRIPGDNVSILLGSNVPEVHWVIEQRRAPENVRVLCTLPRWCGYVWESHKDSASLCTIKSTHYGAQIPTKSYIGLGFLVLNGAPGMVLLPTEAGELSSTLQANLNKHKSAIK
ncbi:hypothetical protein X801_05626 [Opisthorchis viverrini]|uniref:Uncharacterized protein n=1 Tax=Opisthorchis viverrini TaxID=6198 RepID=A0A1S8WVF1_OPIVI|nr:hypothetical protein X801_05626 [Opisthorchis viverrini]